MKILLFSCLLFITGCSNKWDYVPWWNDDPSIGTIQEVE